LEVVIASLFVPWLPAEPPVRAAERRNPGVTMAARADANIGSPVEIRGLTKRYGTHYALRDIDLTVERGELFSLLGSSGCGKTTLLRSLAGFVRPDEGSILIGGRDVTRLAPYERPVNMMFQSYALFPHLTVEGNIAFGLRRDRLARPEIARRVDEALELIRMSDLRRRMPQQLSGGQRQRVALARAVVKRPQVLLLDEPLSALDRKLRESTRMELVAIQEQIGITFVLVTHDQDEALTMSSRIAVMSEGRIVQIGTPTEIYDKPRNRFVADFIGSVNLFEGVVASISAGIATVECATLSARLQAADRGFAVGDKVALAVRPERMTLSPPEPAAPSSGCFAGIVSHHSFAGDRHLYRVALEGGAVVQVAQLSAGTDGRAFPRGEAVEVSWDPASNVLVGP
jgi:putrescine transport system ATP-binding protein